MCSYERAGWLGSRDLGKRAGNFAIWTLHPGYRDERRDEFWRSGWHRLALPAVFSTSEASHLTATDRALRVTDAKVGPKVKIFVFRHVCFVSPIWRQNSSPGSLNFCHLGNRAKISHMNPRQNSSRWLSQPGQPGLYGRPLENVVGRQITNWVADEGSGEVEIWASVLS